MKRYKIVEVEPYVFKAYYKGWIFWHCYQYYGWFASIDNTFSSLGEAERFLTKVKHEDIKSAEIAKQKKEFKKVTRLYPPLKLPGDCD